MDQVKRIAVAGCKHTTLDLILGLERNGIETNQVITISPKKGAEQKVAGYYDLGSFLEGKAIPYYRARKYSLASAKDRKSLLGLNLDLVLVMGWQRLLPDWFLESLGIGAYGMHGSSKPLPHGRGRSPLNWSLIQGKDVFYTHLFRYLPGMDDGPIVGVQTFDITPHDDCHTLHFKNLSAMIKLCATHVPKLLDGTASLTQQPTEGATYYPKRSAQDGLIFWDNTVQDIYNLIRAVTRPFPGAFCYLGDEVTQRVNIWRAIPFDTKLTWPEAQVGEIVQVFYDGSFVVQAGDHTLLVLESDGLGISPGEIGKHFGPAGNMPKIWENLPE